MMANISVAMTTHRRAAYLQKALESVMEQTLLPKEIVICEDGMDPDTERVVQSFRGFGVEIRYIRNSPPLGQLLNRVQAMSLTTSGYVAMLDDDDQWEPTFLEKTYGALEEHPECGFCSTDHALMDGDGNLLNEASEQLSRQYGRADMETGIDHDVMSRALEPRPYTPHVTLFRRTVLEGIGYFPSYGGTVPDLALFMELGAAGVSAYYIKERLGRYRTHGGQQTSRRIENSLSKVECFQRFSERHRLKGPYRHVLSKMYRSSVLELSIAYAHKHQLKDSLFTLTSRYNKLGFGVPPIRRLFILFLLWFSPLWKRSPVPTKG